MKRALTFALAVALVLCGCAAPAQEPAEPAQPQQAEESEQIAEPEAEQIPAFDLDAYKSAVDTFRRDIVDCTLNLSKLAAYEVAHMDAAMKVRGSIDSEKTAEFAFKKLEEEHGVPSSTFEAVNEKIRTEYADLIVTEIEGKEAEELDSYVRSMYENFSDLYKAAQSASPANYNSFVECIADAMAGISNANDNIGLFCGEYNG